MAPISHHLAPLAALTLNDPFDPEACCIGALYTAVFRISFCGSALPFQVNYLRAAMSFLARPRSAAEHIELREHLFTCRCDLTNPDLLHLHSHIGPSNEDLYEITHFLLCKMLGGFARMIDFNMTMPDAKRRWPHTTADFRPCGGSIAELCNALLAWTDGARCVGAFSIIGCLATAWPEFEAHVLRTPRIFACATWYLAAGLREAKAQPDHPHLTLALTACAADLFHALARDRAEGADVLLRGIEPTMAAVARGVGPYVVPGRPRGVVGMVDDGMTECCAWFALVSAREGRAFAPCGVLPPPPPTGMGTGLIVEAAWAILLDMRNRKCTALGVGCMAGAAARSTLMCSGCGVARYCSIAHQRAQWRAQKLPHKIVCGNIKALRTALDMEDDVRWQRLIYNPAGRRDSRPFQELCSQRGVSMDLILAVLRAVGFPVQGQGSA
ncbi:hypothetical protein B0H15DRAFT_841479 [Mycena belliarum]|uniref:MYND-type domain-containing protein n=1 Tax=Mycena belliarum TaxID=1033014 RepID=A0AAD6XRY7_9AGAR|nr:hypothetical protein B0H15DRAFT_841479 [Mycena belliae]